MGLDNETVVSNVSDNGNENFVSFENMQEILSGISAKLQTTSMTGGASQGTVRVDARVGYVTWQMNVMPDFLKLDGSTLANASTEYAELLTFARDNLLITDAQENQSKFKYSVSADALTLPNFMNLVVQGGEDVTALAAGLPNITGAAKNLAVPHTAVQDFSGALYQSSSGASTQGSGGCGNTITVALDASRSSKVYGASDTVQPPAITLIPQIRYKSATATVAVQMQSLTSEQIRTLIDDFGK